MKKKEKKKETYISFSIIFKRSILYWRKASSSKSLSSDEESSLRNLETFFGFWIEGSNVAYGPSVRETKAKQKHKQAAALL